MAENGSLSVSAVDLYLELTEKARRVTELYFQLQTPLYFTYTHLVCRTAVKGNRPQTEYVKT